MAIWQLCANLLIPNCLRSNLSYSPLAALELYVNKTYPKFAINKYTALFIAPLIKAVGKNYEYTDKWQIEDMKKAKFICP